MSLCASYIGWQGVWKTKRTTEFRNTASLRSVANPAKGINLLSPNFLTNFSSPDPFVKNSIDLSILHIYDSPLTTESHEPIPFQAQKRPAFSPLHVDCQGWLLFIKPIPSCEELLEHVCASRLYLSLPSAVSRAPFYPRTLAPREGRARGWISRRPVRNIPSPPASSSLSPYPPLSPRAMSQATFAPGARELGGLLGALLPPLLTPLTAHKVRTVRGRWFQGVARMGTDHKCTNIWTRA